MTLPARAVSLLACALTLASVGLPTTPTMAPATAAATGATAPKTPARAPRCGDTITRDTQLKTDLDCRGAAVGLRVRAGVLLDLGGHTITVQGTRRSIVVTALAGRASTTEITNGSLVGGRGIAMTGTDDAVDDGRVQRLRLSWLETADADLDLVDAAAVIVRSTMIRPELGLDHGRLDVQRSTLTDVDAHALGPDADPANTWNLASSSVSGAWWSSGDTTVSHSTVIDTAEPGARTPAYRNLVIDHGTLQGPVSPITALGGEHTITDSSIDRSGGFVVDDRLTVTRSTFKRTGPLDSGTTGSTVVVGTDFTAGRGAALVSGHDVQVDRSLFRASVGVAIAGDTVEVTRTRLRGGQGADTVSALTLSASGNSLFRNEGAGLHSRGGAADVSGNTITQQRGDGIVYDAFTDGTPATGDFRVGDNRVTDGLGWGILTAANSDPARIADLGGNIASGNAAGQCSAPIACSAE